MTTFQYVPPLMDSAPREEETFDGWEYPGETAEEAWDTVGSILGGVAGGLLGGPLAAVAGGIAGRALGATADRPAAPRPTPTPTSVQPTPAPPVPSMVPEPQPPSAGTVAVPTPCVTISALPAPTVACPVGSGPSASRPLRMPSPGIGRFELNPVITSFAADLAQCYANRKGGPESVRARTGSDKVEQLARDYAATLTAGLVRYGAGWKKHANGVVTRRTKELRQKRRGEFTGEDLAALEQTRCEQEVWLAAKMNWLRTGWMIGRREQVDFQTLMPSSLRGLPNFNPPALPAGTKPSLVDIAPQGSGTPVTSETKAFLVELRRRATGFDAGNYAGHGGGTFRGRGFSVDLMLRGALDSRDFYPRDDAAAFLLKVDAAARAVGLRWRALYNDFAVAAHINRIKGARHVVFVGDPAKNLNWHGPLVLHFHLDLAP